MHSNRKNIIPLMCVVVAVITVLLCILEDCGIINLSGKQLYI